MEGHDHDFLVFGQCVVDEFLRVGFGLLRFGFVFRQTDSQVLVHVNPKMPDQSRLFDRDNWYLLDGDSDS